MRTEAAKTIEDRIRAIEDRLEIYNLIASHPPSADTGAQSYVQSIYTEDGVLDLGGAKRADGSSAISHIVTRPEHSAAIKGGLAHFAGLPHVVIDGDSAVVTSYLQILAPHPTADEIEVPGHGARQRRSARIACAALCPLAPVTPPPGCVPEPHMYNPASGAR
jgi:hypothetical protein